MTETVIDITGVRWKLVGGLHKDRFLVSETGLIRWIPNHVNDGILRKPFPTRGGYLIISYKDFHQRSKSFLVHRAVAIAFIPNPGNKPCVNHKDSDRTNNVVTNLEWSTYVENVNHSLTEGHRDPHAMRGATNPNALLAPTQVLEIMSLKGTIAATILCKRYGTKDQTIRDIWTGRSWAHLFGLPSTRRRSRKVASLTPVPPCVEATEGSPQALEASRFFRAPLPLERKRIDGRPVVLIATRKGSVALVDLVDADLAAFSWSQDSYGYFVRRNTDPITGTLQRHILHRVIGTRMAGRMLASHEEVDHIEGNPLDDRRSKLRIVTHRQNMQNRRSDRGSSSQYVGVSALRDRVKRPTWTAYVTVDGKTITAGSFHSELEAAWMRDQYAIALHGEFARLNFEYLSLGGQAVEGSDA